jgi:hypothetical protein
VYASLNIIRAIESKGMKWSGYVTRVREMRSSYNILVRKIDGKRLLGIPRRR